MTRAHSRNVAKPSASYDPHRLHRDAIVIDSEGVTVLLPSVHIPPAPIEGRAFLDRALAAGLTAMNTTMGLGGIASGIDDFRALLNSIYGHLVYFELHPDKLLHVQRAADVESAKRDGKLGVIFGVQGFGSKMEGDLTLIRILHKLGLRIVQLTNNERNALGCGCIERPDTGLTQLGRAAIAEMNRIGMLVDLAHAGERTALEAFEASRAPCIVSHANARALNDHWRNLTDEMLRALAAKNGVIGITAYAAFCQPKSGTRPTVHDVIDHIAYVADLVGIDHVGIGSDFFESESEVRYADFASYYPAVQRGFRREETCADGFERIDHFPRLTEALVERHFTEADIKKILGGNHLRVFRDAWRG
jgi:membrane dipeptidase